MRRLAYAISNLWYGVWALWDGTTRGSEFGWRIAPRFGFMLDLITLWTLPFLCAGVCGTIGSFLGLAAFGGSVAEALAQFFVAVPYKPPLSAGLIHWIPEL